MLKKLLTGAGALVFTLALASIASAGEYHAGNNLLCYDCHTVHYSMQHSFNGGSVSSSGVIGGGWLGTPGPNQYLLKAPVNDLCLGCHNGQTFAPDVLGTNTNTSPENGREAGALNSPTLGTPYETWKGHTLGSTDTPPGFDPAAVGLSPTWYDPAEGLECVSCHSQHGVATAYRNLGPYSLGHSVMGNFQPTYTISTTNDPSKDVWIDIDPTSYTAASASVATFNPYYATANIFFNRNDTTLNGVHTSNKIGSFCSACHADFHGGAGDTATGGDASSQDGFLRHPTSGVTIGASTSGGHSSLSQFVANTTKVKVATTDYSGYTDATPICITCHKAHGNQNPFGLIFLSGNADTASGGTGVTEQGGYASGQTQNLQTGYRNLCGQCHGQGNHS